MVRELDAKNKLFSLGQLKDSIEPCVYYLHTRRYEDVSHNVFNNVLMDPYPNLAFVLLRFYLAKQLC